MRAFFSVTLVAGILLAVLVMLFGHAVLPSYLAAWLFASAIPFGALPAVMLGGLFNRPSAALRMQLWLAPLAALAVIPLLLHLPVLFPAGLPHITSFARFWFSRPAFVIRIIVSLFLWTILALIFSRPWRAISPPAAILGLSAHLILGTVIANSLAMIVEPNWHATDFGILFIVSQSVIAVSFAVLSGAAQLRRVLLSLLAAWAFLQFTQYLIIWSADLPSEIPWYIHRDAGFGSALEAGGFALGVVVPAILLAYRARLAVRCAAALAIIVQAFNMLWFITPSYRVRFTLTGFDIAEMAALAAIAFALLNLRQARP